jgi:hypothetical protein
VACGLAHRYGLTIALHPCSVAHINWPLSKSIDDQEKPENGWSGLNVERDMLAELVQIKWIMLALFVAVFLTIVFFAVAMAFRIRTTNAKSLLFIRDNFLVEMSLLESKGDYDGLLVKSIEMLETYPNDLLANWYNAWGNRKTGQLGAALSALGRVKTINSAWSVAAVDGMIAEIKSEMRGPTRT